MPKGQIIKVLAGFYYVDTGEKVVSCKARGKFRNRGQIEIKKQYEASRTAWS